MAKRRQFNTKILSPGIMDSQLHYGIWSKLNKKSFIIAVLSDSQNPLKSAFQCTCGDVQSEPEAHPSTAVNTCYKRVFGTNTEYSGLEVIGFDNEAIIQELITDISFFPIFLRIEKLNVVIPCIGNLDENRFYGVGTGFVPTFTTRYCNALHLFVLKIKEDHCVLEIYLESICINTIIGKTPDKIWNLVEVLKKFIGSYLFGIINSLVQEHLQKLKKKLKRHLRRGYEEELVVKKNAESNMILAFPTAFSECINYHEERCTNCDQLFEVLDLLCIQCL
ncbi:18162_t:CDS:2 [Gigaspora margarita]|uniref:18162_t:CDS:1 n=1 Tax=Gigaspora margarita TaxID=4874 RepID=A0ABM8VWL9_GIGMA|nr:18162_t:CDS:2 [Gigaspora margarita]